MEARTKNTPGDEPITEKAGKLLSNKWVLYGGIGVAVLVGGYYLINSQSANASTTSNGSAGVSYGTPVDYGSVVPSSGGSTTTTDGSGSDALLAAIQAQSASDQASQQANLAAIQTQANVALAGDYTNIDLANISATTSNYASSTALATQFLKSAGSNVIGVGGSVTPTAGGGVDIGLFSANQKQPLDYTDILHQVAKTTVPQIGTTSILQQPTASIPVGNATG